MATKFLHRSHFRWMPSMALLLIGLLGCGTLPDTSGFTESTVQLRSAWVATGTATTAEVKTATDAKAVKLIDKDIKELKAALDATTKSLDAMVDYATSLQSIVDAGNAGATSAQAVADSVQSLADAVGVSPAGAAAKKLIDLSTQTIAFVYGELAKHRAAKNLEEALEKFAPAMIKISKLVEAQVADTQRLFDAVVTAENKRLRSASSGGYGNWLKPEEDLNNLLETKTMALVAALKEGNQAKINAAKQAIKEVEDGLKALAPRTKEYREKMASLKKREAAGAVAIASARSAIMSWLNAHRSLVKAVKERKPFSAASLAAAIVETKALVQRWREL